MSAGRAETGPGPPLEGRIDVRGAAGARETLDVRHVELAGLALWCARGGAGGGLRVRRLGAPLLAAPAHLKLQIEHNLSDSHNVPDSTLQGTLATLQCALDPSQYRLVRGVLAHNLGDSVDDLLPPPAAEQRAAHYSEQVGAAQV